MTLWLDAQLSPHLAAWLARQFDIEAVSAARLGLHDADDESIFHAARAANAVVMTKDHDFVRLVERFGPPPAVIWLTCGNTSNRHLQTLLANSLAQVLALLDAGESLVEISDRK
ncbi:DUF5615 family PIN-like protein [Salinisphaera sp. P385]|uniref:DUF5615 family PIN-like protein n=1 Tax=Spectribacter acetivorans TaxID=3075603 RepID=A0ABU3B581_9GAMM|nr:DUF5615 family PIN-like protein [Salinisphaera sp. P385]MDT0617617.1 DUF5615 family PIN-like protein [Salinisphaera sp. P385]